MNGCHQSAPRRVQFAITMVGKAGENEPTGAASNVVVVVAAAVVAQ